MAWGYRFNGKAPRICIPHGNHVKCIFLSSHKTPGLFGKGLSGLFLLFYIELSLGVKESCLCGIENTFNHVAPAAGVTKKLTMDTARPAFADLAAGAVDFKSTLALW